MLLIGMRSGRRRRGRHGIGGVAAGTRVAADSAYAPAKGRGGPRAEPQEHCPVVPAAPAC